MDMSCGNMLNIILRSSRTRRKRGESMRLVSLTDKTRTSTATRKVARRDLGAPQTSSHTFYGWRQTKRATPIIVPARSAPQIATKSLSRATKANLNQPRRSSQSTHQFYHLQRHTPREPPPAHPLPPLLHQNQHHRTSPQAPPLLLPHRQNLHPSPLQS